MTPSKYIPNLCANFLFVRQMSKNGKKVIFERETVYNDVYQIYSKIQSKINNAFIAEKKKT